MRMIIILIDNVFKILYKKNEVNTKNKRFV